MIQTPTSVAWMPGSKTGALTFQYLDASQNTGPLQAGANSATIVVLTNQPVHDPAGKSSKRQSGDHLSHGLLSPGGYDPRSPRSRARDRAGMGRYDRRRRPGSAFPREPSGGLS